MRSCGTGLQSEDNRLFSRFPEVSGTVVIVGTFSMKNTSTHEGIRRSEREFVRLYADLD